MQEAYFLQTDEFDILQYHPETPAFEQAPPVLITFALVNTPEILNISPERSFVERLVALGMRVYLIDWKEPKTDQTDKSLADYILRDIGLAAQSVYQHTQQKLYLLGVCQGGYFNLCYAIVRPNLLAGLILLVTPVDFHVAHNRIYQMIKYIDIEQRTLHMGNIPGGWINPAIFAASPFQVIQKKLQLMQMASTSTNTELIQKIEHWAWRSPVQAKRAFIEFVQSCIQQNALLNQQLMLDGEVISLEHLTVNTLNIYAAEDPIWPMSCSQALRQYVPSARYQEYVHSGGHIGVMVSQAGLQNIPQTIYQWIRANS